MGYIGLVFQLAIIREAMKFKDDILYRSFYYQEISKDYPKTRRIRDSGVGDVVLGMDHHWSLLNDFSGNQWIMQLDDVGFLSVPDAEKVLLKVKKEQKAWQ